MSTFPKADFDWARNGAPAELLSLLNSYGEARYVGGCVRDSLLGLPPGVTGRTDIDIATTLLPNAVMNVLQSSGIRNIPTGIDHGTITAILNHVPYEITTLRNDVSTDGRRADVSFTDTWEQDAARRDFTINALYLDAEGRITDFHNGQSDLTAGKVRFIGDADQRIKEDYLRILRFLRFSTRFAKSLDEDGWAACIRLKKGLDSLSRERIWSEVARLFFAKRSPGAIFHAANSSVLSHICHAKSDPDLYARVHTSLDHPMSASEGLAALWPEASREILQKAFKPSGSILDDVEAIQRAVIIIHANAGARLLLYRSGREIALKACYLAYAMRRVSVDPEYLRDIKSVSIPTFPVKGSDFVTHGVPQGPKVGAAQKYFEQAWIAAGFPDDRDAIDHLMAAAVKSV